MSCHSYKLNIGLVGAPQILEKGLTKSYEDDFVKVYSGSYTLAEALAFFRNLGYTIQHPSRSCDDLLALRIAQGVFVARYEECDCYQQEITIPLDYSVDYTLTVTNFNPLNGDATGCENGLFDACYTLTTVATVTYSYGTRILNSTQSLNSDCQCCNVSKTLNCDFSGFYGINASISLDCTNNHNPFTTKKCKFCSQCVKYPDFLPCNHPHNCFEYDIPEEITATVTFKDPSKLKQLCLGTNCTPGIVFQPTGAAVWNGSYTLTRSTNYNNTYSLGDLTVCRYPNPVPNYINLRLTDIFGLPLNITTSPDNPNKGCIGCGQGFQLRVIFIHPGLLALAGTLCTSAFYPGPIPLTAGAIFSAGLDVGGIAPRPLYGISARENNLFTSNQFVLPGCTASLS
jgi:hypothetical protein